jgi:hypothetical protein
MQMLHSGHLKFIPDVSGGAIQTHLLVFTVDKNMAFRYAKWTSFLWTTGYLDLCNADSQRRDCPIASCVSAANAIGVFRKWGGGGAEERL